MGKRLVFGLEAGAFLALLALPAAVILLVLANGFDGRTLLILGTPPSIAALGFMVAMVLVPDLAGDFKFRSPMNLTYPVLFAVVNLTVARGFWFSTSVVLSPNQVLDPIQLWFDPRLILLTLVIQVIGMTIACVTAREPQTT